jgi:NADPH-dependent 2,4-dienoyl-CoA reductase/sulfur reductase-like enzyme
MAGIRTHSRRKILVVGGLAAGPSAAAKAKRTNPDCDVTLYESGETISYGICEAPYAIGGTIADESGLVLYTPERLYEEKGVVAKTLHHVQSIDTSHHTISVRDLASRRTEDVPYDRLILATGAIPRKLGLPGEQARNVFHLRSREETRAISAFIEMSAPRSAVIIGGGYIGLEMAEALRNRNLEVTILHRHALPLGGTEDPCGQELLHELKRNDVHAVMEAKVEAMIVGSAGRVTHVVTKKGTFEADLVLVAAGIEPNAALARDARIRVGKSGGILTDERQLTNVDGIYAAGDCCEVKSIVTGKPAYIPLATLASRCGWVAGENAAGGKAVFKGAVRAAALKVFSLEVAQVGLTGAEASAAGFNVAVEAVSAYDRIKAMPGSCKVHVHLVVDRRTGRLIGATLFGASGAVMRANVLGVAILQHMTVEDISRFDMIYAPPFAPLWDPVLVAANQARKNLNKE